MTTTAKAPTCGHWRHWNDGVQDDGTGDWETCDQCSRLVCFDIRGCPNGWVWVDGSILCYRCRDLCLCEEEGHDFRAEDIADGVVGGGAAHVMAIYCDRCGEEGEPEDLGL